MSQFNIDEIEKRTLSGLKDFQRATVERVDYLFRHNQNRVLVADEVGMGKTLIARGAIVKTARLRIEEKDDLFKVIYICSNQNIANQNIRKLDVTGKNAIGSVSDTRLSMQHLKITEQENDPQIKEGFIQLIPLTPEISFRMTTGGGSVQERALMYAILRRMPDFKGHVTSLEKFMIGALVSYEAERLTVGKLVHQIKNQDKKNTGYFADGSRRYPVARLRFNVSNGEVRGMSLFALLYPSKTLSDMYLPIESLNNHESLEVIEKSVRLKLKEKLAIIEEKYGDSGNNKEDARWYYLAPMLMDGVIYAKHWIEDIVWEMNTDEEDTTSEVRSSSKDKRNKGFIAHIDKLRSYLDAPEEIHLGRKPEDLLETLVNMVLGSPAICIYRSNGRSTARATSLAKVFVNNFNLPESTAIIDLAYGRCRDDNSHWQNVLKYCKDGCFQAMIDEYIHMLKETAGFQSDGNQYQIVHDMMMDSLKIHTATYIADTYPDFKKRINGADRKSDGCRIRSSYAVGFTKDAGDNSKVVMRKENIRNAFNSPMRPFVLATTSIGQEGLDFHNYCRVIMHWNLPSNPIDVGRILRTFKIKKNVEVTDNGKIII